MGGTAMNLQLTGETSTHWKRKALGLAHVGWLAGGVLAQRGAQGPARAPAWQVTELKNSLLATRTLWSRRLWGYIMGNTNSAGNLHDAGRYLAQDRPWQLHRLPSCSRVIDRPHWLSAANPIVPATCQCRTNRRACPAVNPTSPRRWHWRSRRRFSLVISQRFTASPGPDRASSRISQQADQAPGDLPNLVLAGPLGTTIPDSMREAASRCGGPLSRLRI